MNIIEALLKANNERRDQLAQLDRLEAFAGPSPGITLSRMLAKHLIAQAEDAISLGSIEAMLAAAAAHGIGSESTEREANRALAEGTEER